MLDDAARVANYQAQNGYPKDWRLTPKQNRRVNKKRHHQSSEAQDRRDQAVRARMLAAEKRNRREAGLSSAVNAASPST